MPATDRKYWRSRWDPLYRNYHFFLDHLKLLGSLIVLGQQLL
jgi:hypothetical protein